MMIAESSDEPVDLRSAVEAGIRDCYEGLLNPRIKTFGLESLTQWAKLVADPKGKRGWPKTFEDPAELYNTLTWVHHWIETGGTGGGALRGMYAEFLDEAATILGKPGSAAWQTATARRAGCGRHWRMRLCRTRSHYSERHAS